MVLQKGRHFGGKKADDLCGKIKGVSLVSCFFVNVSNGHWATSGLMSCAIIDMFMIPVSFLQTICKILLLDDESDLLFLPFVFIFEIQEMGISLHVSCMGCCKYQRRQKHDVSNSVNFVTPKTFFLVLYSTVVLQLQ